MPSIPEIVGLVMALALPVLAVIAISRMLRRRKWGGRQTAATMFGSTWEFLNEDQRRAAEVVVEEKAGKKREEDASGQDDGDDDDNASSSAERP